MNPLVRLACNPEIISISIKNISPIRRLSTAIIKSDKYQRIAASIREVGIIEPPVVYPQQGTTGQYILLDGHMRLEILKEFGQDDVDCLVAIDDEAFTYNQKVNQVSPIQEHFMILKVLDLGVPEDRVAKAINVDVSLIRKKRDMLEGICPEAVALLKHTRTSADAFHQIRKVKPMRQIEIAELMVASNNYSASYARCLYIATPVEQQIEPIQAKEAHGLGVDDIARMEREMESVTQDFRMIEESHGKNVLNLVLVVGYLKKLLDNARVVRYLSRYRPEVLSEFQKIVETKSLSTGE